MNIIKKTLKKFVNLIHDYFMYEFYISYPRKTYTHIKEFQSRSEKGYYLTAIKLALKNQRSFDNFKRLRSYQNVLEHASKQQGKEYLKILSSRKDGILTLGMSTVLISDSVGNPIKFKYDNYTVPLSPTTLRYMKVSSDLQILFGNKLGKVAEIGCGYGGQTLVNDQLLNVETAKLFDLPIVNKLIDRYLNSFLLNGAYNTTVINKEVPQEYDLVISNYAFSELPKKLQLKYINKVLSKAKRGFLIMNSGKENSRFKESFSLNELKELLPKFLLIEEEPLSSDQNYIIVWGYSEKSLDGNFKIIHFD
jgi:putative sugar O-methyltransferase